MATAVAVEETPARDPLDDLSDEDLFEVIICGLEEAVARGQRHADAAASPRAAGSTVKAALKFSNDMRQLLPVWGKSDRLTSIFRDGIDVTDEICRGG